MPLTSWYTRTKTWWSLRSGRSLAHKWLTKPRRCACVPSPHPSTRSTARFFTRGQTRSKTPAPAPLRAIYLLYLCLHCCKYFFQALFVFDRSVWWRSGSHPEWFWWTSPSGHWTTQQEHECVFKQTEEELNRNALLTQIDTWRLTCSLWPTCHTQYQTAISPGPQWSPDM